MKKLILFFIFIIVLLIGCPTNGKDGDNGKDGKNASTEILEPLGDLKIVGIFNGLIPFAWQDAHLSKYLKGSQYVEFIVINNESGKLCPEKIRIFFHCYAPFATGWINYFLSPQASNEIRNLSYIFSKMSGYFFQFFRIITCTQ